MDDDRRAGLEVVDEDRILVVASETTPKRRRNWEGFDRVEIDLVVGLSVVVENFVRSKVNFRLAIAVSDTDLAGVTDERDLTVVAVSGDRVVGKRPRFRGTNAGELRVMVVESVGGLVVGKRFF